MKFETRIVLGLALLFATALPDIATAQIPRTISFQGVLTDLTGTPIPNGPHSLVLSIYDVQSGGNPLHTETQSVATLGGIFNVIIGASGGLPVGLRFDRPYYLGVKVDAGQEFPRTAMTSVPYSVISAQALVADSAAVAGRAVIASVADAAATLAGGAVNALNGLQGNLFIEGGGGATVTQVGNVIVVSTASGGGIQSINNIDTTMSIDQPNGPFVTITLRADGIRDVHIRADAVTTTKIKDAAVTTSKIADNAVTTDKIPADAVQNTDVQNNAITASKISTGSPAAANGLVLMSNGATTPVWGSPSAAGPAGGDLAGNYPNPTININAGPAIVSAINNNGGTINDNRLTNNVALENISNTFATTNAFQGNVTLSNTTNAATELRLAEPSGGGANFSAFKAQSQSADVTYTLPNAGPTAPSQVLKVQSVAGNNSTLSWGTVGGGSIAFTRVGKVSAAGNTLYTMAATDDIVGVDQLSGVPFTITLPAATTSGKIVIIKLEKQNTTTFPNLTIGRGGTDLIDNGTAPVTFANAGGFRHFYSDGAGNWYSW